MKIYQNNNLETWSQMGKILKTKSVTSAIYENAWKFKRLYMKFNFGIQKKIMNFNRDIFLNYYMYI